MKSHLGTRLTRLEVARPSTAKWHRIVQMPGVTREAALDIYGRHLIAPDDNLVIRRVADVPMLHGSVQ